MKKCVIIMNPNSGKKKKIKTYEKFYDLSRKYGYDLEIIFTERKGHAIEIMKELPNDIDLVLSGGGDGTLNEIVTGNISREKKLVIAPLPLGSTNDVGSMYGLDKSIYENYEMILKGQPKSIDICYINDTPFVYVACFGDYLDLAYSTPRALKEKYGKLAYIFYGLKQLKNKLHHYNIKYTIDGVEHEGTYSFIFITNSSRIAGQNDVYYDIKLDDDKFEVAFANINSKKEVFKLLVLINSIEIKDIPGVDYFQTNNLKIEFSEEPNISWGIDGEEFISKEKVYEFRMEKNMKMQVPKGSIKKLFKD